MQSLIGWQAEKAVELSAARSREPVASLSAPRPHSARGSSLGSGPCSGKAGARIRSRVLPSPSRATEVAADRPRTSHPAGPAGRSDAGGAPNGTATEPARTPPTRTASAHRVWTSRRTTAQTADATTGAAAEATASAETAPTTSAAAATPPSVSERNTQRQDNTECDQKRCS